MLMEREVTEVVTIKMGTLTGMAHGGIVAFMEEAAWNGIAAVVVGVCIKGWVVSLVVVCHGCDNLTMKILYCIIFIFLFIKK